MIGIKHMKKVGLMYALWTEGVDRGIRHDHGEGKAF
ncbi:Uncharacterised protein [Mycobacterium tuberculosis]|nr:Uncharacterised protein [Mycobacterium tuberculosis]